jgi:hypothetical protein
LIDYNEVPDTDFLSIRIWIQIQGAKTMKTMLIHPAYEDVEPSANTQKQVIEMTALEILEQSMWARTK